MGKRIRSISVRWDDESDLQITRHAIERFRSRVAKVPPAMVPAEIGRMMRNVTPIPCPKRNDDGRVYLQHKECVFVITRGGIIVTVLTPMDSPVTNSRKKPPIRRRPSRQSNRSQFQ